MIRFCDLLGLGLQPETIPSAPMADIFLSYERSDYPRAQKIAAALEQHGWSVWWDRKLMGGARFDKAIEHALSAARCVITLWSKGSVSSDWLNSNKGTKSDMGVWATSFAPRPYAQVVPPIIGAKRRILGAAELPELPKVQPEFEMPLCFQSLRFRMERAHLIDHLD